MKLALISPIPHLQNYYNYYGSNYHLILAHLCQKNNVYKEFYINLKKDNPEHYVILDNGANENQCIKGRELIELADEIKVDEIIAPDIYQSAVGTITETFNFLDTFYDKFIKEKFKVMAVPHGLTEEEILGCYNSLISDKRINTIGIGYKNFMSPFINHIANVTYDLWKEWGIDNIEYLANNLEENTYYYTLSRLYFLKNYVNFKGLKMRKKKIHLLGIYNPIEISLYKKMFSEKQLECINGCDSAAPFQAAQKGIDFNENYGVVSKPKALLDFDQDINESRMVTLLANLMKMKEWSK